MYLLYHENNYGFLGITEAVIKIILMDGSFWISQLENVKMTRYDPKMFCPDMTSTH